MTEDVILLKRLNSGDPRVTVDKSESSWRTSDDRLRRKKKDMSHKQCFSARTQEMFVGVERRKKRSFILRCHFALICHRTDKVFERNELRRCFGANDSRRMKRDVIPLDIF